MVGGLVGDHYPEIYLAGFGSFGEPYWFHVMLGFALRHFFTPQTNFSCSRLSHFGFSLQILVYFCDFDWT